jgi:peptide/nickel transport system substrate-binding protein
LVQNKKEGSLVKKWFLPIAIILIVAFALSACAPTPAPTTPAAKPTTPAPAAGPTKGGVMNISFTRPPVNFGYPPKIVGPDQNFSRPAFEKLILLDNKFEYQPELATSWEIAPDGKTITFKLRQGVKFHDGTDFNADAVIFNYKEYLPPKSSLLAGVTSIEKIDPYTVKFNLSAFSNLIFFMLGADSRMGIASPTAIEKNGADWALTNPVGTGPFKLKGFERNTSITYESFPDYWDKANYYLDGIKYIAIADPMTALAAFKAGDVNIMYDARIEVASQLAKEGYQLYSFPGTMQAYSFDTDHPDSVFANQKVREALEYAVDKEAICNGPLLGLYKPGYQIAATGTPEYNPNCPPRKYDPVKAKQLLTEAGYADGFSFKYFINETETQDPPTAVQNYLSKIGVKMEIVKLAPAAFENTVRIGGQLEKNSAAHMVIDYRADLLFTQNTYLRSNTLYYKNTVKPAGLDSLLDKAIAEKDKAAKTKLIQEINKAIYDNASFIPMQLQPRIAILDKKIQDPGMCQAGDCNNPRWGYKSWLKQ